MKRHTALVPLSDDHHGALVLARRLQRMECDAGPSGVAALALEVRGQFEADLEPHFCVEERHLFPVLAQRGAPELAERALQDHAQLRALVEGSWSEATAVQFGARLEQHVRFEERELFPAAEVLLSEEELARVCEAALARPSARARRHR